MRYVVLFLCFGALVCGQSNVGSITGLVTDPSGAAIPSASITATNTATGIVFKSTSNASGTYLFPSLINGPYTVSVEAPGFTTRRLEEIVLQTAQQLRLDAALTPGTVKEAIEVTAVAPQINQDNGELSTVITSNQIQNLPLNGRSPYQVLDFAPGITTGRFDPSSPDYSSDASVNGSRTRSTSFSVDGASTMAVSGLNERVGSIEAIQEVKVMTNSFSAKYGRTSGGVVTFQVKSGSSRYNGYAYEYHRDGSWNANQWETNANPSASIPVPRTRDEFGFAYGGPIPFSRNKLFFFATHEHTKNIVPTTRQKTIPELAFRQGNFSGSPIVVYDPLTGLPFPNNTIPASRLDPVAVKYLALFPSPNTAGTFNSRYGNYSNNYINNTATRDNGDYTIFRIDYNARDPDRLYLTFTRSYECPATRPKNSTASFRGRTGRGSAA